MGLETSAIVLATSQAIGTASSIYSARARSSFERTLLDINRGIAERAALDALRRGELESAFVRRKGKALAGLQQAQAAASGIDLFQGSAAALQEEAKLLSDFDRMMIKVSSIREAYGYRTAALEAAFRRRLARIGERTEIGQGMSAGIEDIARTVARGQRKEPSSPPATEGARQILSVYPLY